MALVYLDNFPGGMHPPTYPMDRGRDNDERERYFKEEDGYEAQSSEYEHQPVLSALFFLYAAQLP